MILLVHILVGAAIVKIINPFWLALIIALISHYFLDAFPHWEYKIEKINPKNKYFFIDWLKIFLDLFGGFAVVFFLSGENWKIVAGGFVAILPDGLTFLNIVFGEKILQPLQKFHQKIHFQKETNLFLKIIFPLIFVILSLYFLI